MPSIDYPFATTPEHGGVLEVAPGVYWVRMPLPFVLDHINLWLLRDGGGWTLIDTGIGGAEVMAHWEALFDTVMEGRPLKRVIVTHFHPDHVGLADWLTERFGAPLYMSQAEYLTASLARNDLGPGNRAALARFFARHGLDSERETAFAARGNTYARGVRGLPGGYIRLQAGDGIEIDGREWQLRVCRGHAPEHLTLYSPELGVLISGDQVLPRISTNVSVWHFEPEANPLRQFMESLESFRELPGDTLVLPSHGRVFRGLHARLDEYAAHHDERLEQVLAACGEPVSACGLLERLFPRQLDLHQLMFAMGEAIAHLNYLRAEGRLAREEGCDAVYRFVRSGG